MWYHLLKLADKQSYRSNEEGLVSEHHQMVTEKDKALDLAISQIEKQFGLSLIHI